MVVQILVFVSHVMEEDFHMANVVQKAPKCAAATCRVLSKNILSNLLWKGENMNKEKYKNKRETLTNNWPFGVIGTS